MLGALPARRHYELQKIVTLLHGYRVSGTIHMLELSKQMLRVLDTVWELPL